MLLPTNQTSYSNIFATVPQAGELTAQDRYETGEDLTIPTLSTSQAKN